MTAELENHISVLTSQNFEKELSTRKVSIVDFWAPWCAPCKKLAPMFDEAAHLTGAKYGGQVGFYKVNVDEEQALTQRHGVMSLPTVIGFTGTSAVDRFTGRTKEDLLRWIDRLAQNADLA